MLTKDTRDQGVLTRSVDACLGTATPSDLVFEAGIVFDRGQFGDLRQQLVVIENAARLAAVGRVVWVPLGQKPSLAVEELGIASTRVEELLPAVLRPRDPAGQGSPAELVQLVVRLRRAVDLVTESPMPYDHATAVKPLWAGAFAFAPSSVLKPRVVVIDDDEKFLVRAERRLKAICDVSIFQSFQDYLDKGRSSIDDVDLFLIDLVEGEGGGNPEDPEVRRPVLTGLEDVLPRLRRERGLNEFPQVYALSELPIETVGHIAHRLGADYYLEKTLFLAHPDLGAMLGGLMWHTTRGIRRLGTLKLPEGHEEWPGWNTCGDEATARIDVTKRMVWSLFGGQYRLARIDLLEPLSGGLSGAAVLSVQPRIADEEHGAVAGGRAMAPRVVKMDRWRKMAKEWAAYGAHIAPLTTSGFARVEPFFSRDDSDAMISYTLAGSSKGFALGQIVSLRRRMMSRADEVPAIVRHVFADMLGPLHTSATPPVSLAQIVRFMATELNPVEASWTTPPDKQVNTAVMADADIIDSRVVGNGSDVDVMRIDYLPPNRFPLAVADVPIPADTQWLVRHGKRMTLPVPTSLLQSPQKCFKELVEAAAKVKGRVESRERVDLFCEKLATLENPGQPLARFEKTLASALARTTPFAYWSIVHGDLNIENVLCDEGSGEYWMIDFAKTRPGPPAIDYITWEVACRTDLLAREFGQSYLPESSSPEEWLAEARQLIRAFEQSVEENGRVDFRALTDVHRSDDIESRVRAAWQAVLVTRQLAFEGYYRAEAGRLMYDLLLALYCIRALQHYRHLVTERSAPLGALWMQVLFERAAENAAALLPLAT